MKIAVLADEVLKQELLNKGVAPDVGIIWVDSVRALTIAEADAYMDLAFEMDAERTSRLKQLLPKPVIVNAMAWTSRSIGLDVVRINAWPGLLGRPVAEIALPAGMQEPEAAAVFNALQWPYRITPDIPGMITGRVLAAIINEAYYTWGSGVSSKEEIDIAMKLGTNYPMGPFEWCEKIGLNRIYELLTALNRMDTRYTIAPALALEANRH